MQDVTQWVYDLIFTIWMLSGCAFVLGCLVIWLLDERAKKRYLQTLCDEDRKVISDYNAVHFTKRK